MWGDVIIHSYTQELFQSIDSSRLQAVGKGKSEPVVECKGVKGKAAIECLQPNRRVVIYAQEQHKSGCD